MPEKFHQYYLDEPLSKKYSHVTYLASPINDSERQLVLTVFSSFLFRFPHERDDLLQRAQRIKRLQHAHLIPILDLGVEEEQPFIVREYLPNGSLRKHLKSFSPGLLPLRDALEIVLQVGEALAYAHRQNIIHGSIKPENVLLNDNGQAFLTDFHLVSRKDAGIRDQTSEEYAFCYLAPEQFAGITDAKSDQYALGCLTYELITGRVPFAAQSLASMMGQPNSVLPAPLSDNVADLPASLDAAVLKTLAKDPSERFFDFSLFIDVIKSVLSPPPNFPLSHTISSRKNRGVSRPVRSVKVRPIAFPADKHTAFPDPVVPSDPLPEPRELSVVASNTEFNIKNSVNVSYISQVERYEKINSSSFSVPLEFPDQSSYQIPFPFSVEVHPVDDIENEGKADDWFLDEPFVREEHTLSSVVLDKKVVQKEEDSPAKIDKASINESTENKNVNYGNNVYPEAEETVLLAGNPDINGLRINHSGRKVWSLLLLTSVAMGLIVYVFWPLVATTYDTDVHTVNKAQGIIPQVTSVSMEQVPLQPTYVPTIPPLVTETPTMRSSVANTLAEPPSVPSIPVVVQSVVSVKKTLPTRSPTPTPTPMPTAVPTATATNAAITYEAEAPQNTLAGGAQIISCSSCSGGYRVGYIGLGSDGQSGTLQFNNVNKANAGTYTLTLYYSNGSSSDMDEYISVNGGAAIVFSGSPTGSFDTFATVGIAVTLNEGSNTIEFYNPNSTAPDIDKIVV